MVKATVTLLMLSLLSSPCPSEEHGRCEACSTKAQKVRSEGLGLSHSDPAQNTEPFRTSKTKQSPTMQTPETGTKSSHQGGLVTSDFNEKILKAQNGRVSIKPNHASPIFLTCCLGVVFPSLLRFSRILTFREGQCHG